MNINLEYYKIFYEVAKEQNITKASENLHISQPAISKTIKLLEEKLGGTLFVRTKKGVILTEEGKEEGIKAGEKKKAIEIAKGLLDILSIEIIAQKTGLTVDEVKALKDEVK